MLKFEPVVVQPIKSVEGPFLGPKGEFDDLPPTKDWEEAFRIARGEREKRVGNHLSSPRSLIPNYKGKARHPWQRRVVSA